MFAKRRIAVTAVAAIALGTGGLYTGTASAADVDVTVDFTKSIATVSPDDLGTSITGYGGENYIINSVDHRNALAAQDFGLYRIELFYETPGDPTSRLVCGGDYCERQKYVAEDWLDAIQKSDMLGKDAVVVLPMDGRHDASIDVTDAKNIYDRLNAPGRKPVTRFILGNELDNGMDKPEDPNAGNPKKMSAAEYSRRFNLIARELEAKNSAVKLTGPATASDNLAYIRTFLQGSGQYVDFIDYHNYGQGKDDNRPTDVLLAETSKYADRVRAVRNVVVEELGATRAAQIGITVGEWNIDWYDPWQEPNYCSVTLAHSATLWSAAALGYMLEADATAMQFGDKNRCLGLTGEWGEGVNDQDPNWVKINQPMPVYHGIGMFTGEGLFRHFGSTMVQTTESKATIHSFASNNEKNVVLVNAGTTAETAKVAFTGLATGNADVWQSVGGGTQADRAPRQVGRVDIANSATSVTLPAGSVTTLVVRDTAGLKGLTGQYYKSKDLGGLPVTRIDPQVNFAWGSASPAAGIPADDFSVRWTGKVVAPAAATYTFITTSDDGVRLWVDGQLLVDNWTNHGQTDDTGQIALTAGAHDIKLEYFDYNFDATIKLSWQSPTIVREFIPEANLRP